MPGQVNETTLSNQALSLFRKTVSQGSFRRLLLKLFKREDRLLDLENALCCMQVENSAYAGTQAVRIGCIRGTEGKADMFDADFNPRDEMTRDRWLSIAREKLCGHDLPPVEIISVEDVCYVRDGHHRISVARSLGQDFVDGQVTEIKLKGSCNCSGE